MENISLVSHVLQIISRAFIGKCLLKSNVPRIILVTNCIELDSHDLMQKQKQKLQILYLVIFCISALEIHLSNR